METTGFNYKNTEIQAQSGGKKIVRKVSIKNGKGYKSVTKYRHGKKISSVKKHIHTDHLHMIKNGKFVGKFSSSDTMTVFDNLKGFLA